MKDFFDIIRTSTSNNCSTKFIMACHHHDITMTSSWHQYMPLIYYKVHWSAPHMTHSDCGVDLLHEPVEETSVDGFGQRIPSVLCLWQCYNTNAMCFYKISWANSTVTKDSTVTSFGLKLTFSTESGTVTCSLSVSTVFSVKAFWRTSAGPSRRKAAWSKPEEIHQWDESIQRTYMARKWWRLSMGM